MEKLTPLQQLLQHLKTQGKDVSDIPEEHVSDYADVWSGKYPSAQSAHEKTRLYQRAQQIKEAENKGSLYDEDNREKPDLYYPWDRWSTMPYNVNENYKQADENEDIDKLNSFLRLEDILKGGPKQKSKKQIDVKAKDLKNTLKGIIKK
jgi:hypothetical protein